MDTPNLPASWRRPTNSLQNYQAINPVKLQALTVAARRLFSQFKTDATVDPKTYLVAVIELFSHYSDEIVMSVTHPFTGMASKQNWLPTIFEIRKACDRAKDDAAERTVSDAVAETLARRRDAEVAKPPVEKRAEHVARLRAEGKLAFAGDKHVRDMKWFDRMTPSEAQATLNRYEREATETQANDRDNCL